MCLQFARPCACLRPVVVTKEKRSHEASKEMLVNLQEFNSRLAAHGSKGKRADVNHWILYGSHKDNVSEQPDNQSLTCPQDHKGCKTQIYTKTCVSTVCSRCALTPPYALSVFTYCCTASRSGKTETVRESLTTCSLCFAPVIRKEKAAELEGFDQSCVC